MPPPAGLTQRLRRPARPRRRATSGSGPPAPWCPTTGATCRAPWCSRRPGTRPPAGSSSTTSWWSSRSGDEARRPDYRRAPGDAAATGTLLRLATCLEGKVEVVANAVPVFEYGAQTGTLGLRGRRLQHHDREPPGRRPDLHLVVHPPPGLGGRPLLRPHHARPGRVRLRRPVLGWPSAREPRRGPEPARRHRRLLAGLAVQRHLPRPSVAQLHRAQRTDAQGPELCADRRHHGGGDDLAPRDARWGAQLGLPLHLDPRLLLHAALALPARVRLGGARVLRLRDRGGGRGRAATSTCRSCTASTAART